MGRVGGHHWLATVRAQEAAQVGAQLSGVSAALTAAVEIPDPGEVRPPGYGAQEGVLVARHYLGPGLQRHRGGQSQQSSVSVPPGVGDTAVGEEAEDGEQADTLGLPPSQAVTGGGVRQDYPWKTSTVFKNYET